MIMKLYFLTILSFTSFLLQPEDSTMEIPGKHEYFFGVKRNFTGKIKSIFWIASAVAIGLMISKLK